jgi:hypothetical protein
MRLPRCGLARLRIAFLCPVKSVRSICAWSSNLRRNYGPGDRHSRELPRVVPAKVPYARGQDRYAPGIKSKGSRPVTSAAKFAPEDLRNAIFVLIFTAAISIVLICYLSFHEPRDEMKSVCLGWGGFLTDTFHAVRALS